MVVVTLFLGRGRSGATTSCLPPEPPSKVLNENCSRTIYRELEHEGVHLYGLGMGPEAGAQYQQVSTHIPEEERSMAKKQQKRKPKKAKAKEQPWHLEPLHMGFTTIPVVESADIGDWGQYWDAPRPTIKVSPQDESMLPSTLFHELLHALSAAYELNLQEYQVRNLDQLIPMILRQNPELARRLLDLDL